MTGPLDGDDRHLLAAVAAAVLGAQGSATWARTAESLLLSCPEVARRYRSALYELEAVLGQAPSGPPVDPPA
jgi:hypothetical protein